MNPVTKNKSLIAIIIFLLVSNIAVLIFFLVLGNSSKGTHLAKKDMVSAFLKKEIGFSDQQMDTYEKMHKAHWDSLKPYFDDIHLVKDSFYNLLYNSQPDSVIYKRAALIGEKQMAIEVNMFHHFENVRKLCTQEQLPKFDSSFKNLVSKMIGHSRKPDPKDKDPKK